jgi:hypothetical protein
MWFMRQIGLGYHEGDKSGWKWALDFMDWLDNYTYYRTAAEVYSTFKANSLSVNELEHEYINFRLIKKGVNLPSLVRNSSLWQVFAKYTCRKLGGMVIIATKI